jgi:wyosine [tRNA(Phe)-imidazoG37] synthetase (radical SAM superfamily)
MPLSPLDQIVYGPVSSRRLGASLGVNLLPAGMKVCNMDCAYCQYGLSRGAARYRGQRDGWPSVEAVTNAVAARLEEAFERDEWIDRLTLSGHGEPTLHPEFEAIVAGLLRVRDRLAPRLPIAVLSNSTTILWPDIRRSLLLLDERYMKLDAGDPIMFARLNGGRTPIRDVIDGLRTLSPITVQAMFVRDRNHMIVNSTTVAVDHWLWALEAARADRVHIFTLDRPPALEWLEPVPPRRLREIAEQVRAIGIPAEAFVASRASRISAGISTAGREISAPSATPNDAARPGPPR